MKHKNILEEKLENRDIRGRKGCFYTPEIWVKLSQKYLSDVFGKDWQNEYYLWDCCAGTGNLLVGLTNKYTVWASTLDKQEVEGICKRIDNDIHLLENHVFQFDFLNDDFSKLPQDLQDIVNDPQKRKKLIIYINPPYAECGRAKKERLYNKSGVANTNKIYTQYAKNLGNARRELFAQFLIRIYREIPSCVIANFSTLKHLQSANFHTFRELFQAKIEKLFVVPAHTFDDVKGKFPIGFMIWKTNIEQPFTEIQADVYDKKGLLIGKKMIYNYDNQKYINDWIDEFKNKKNEIIGSLSCKLNDFQNANMVYVANAKLNLPVRCKYLNINAENLIPACIYFTVRKIIPATWLNNRDQFLFPNSKWKKDIEFQNDCLAYTLFNNNISSKHGINHWIPFLECELHIRDAFDSHFILDFMSGKLISTVKREFSPESANVFDAGRKLWKYYHKQSNITVNASLYDMKMYFQIKNEKGRMKKKSEDEKYNKLIENLRNTLHILAQKMEPKVYEYGFLMR